jgi:hypothetical protein
MPLDSSPWPAPVAASVDRVAPVSEAQSAGLQSLGSDTIGSEDRMTATEFALAMLSLLLAYGGSYLGEFLLDRFGL